MAELPTVPVAASESLAPSSTVCPIEVEEPAGVPHAARRLRLRCANRAEVCRVPARLENLLPPDHPARPIWETVQGLDLSEFYADIQVTDGTPGAAATDPLILIALWVYATSQGETCARRVADLCVNHLAYIWLCGGVSMNYHTLSDFRTQYGAALDQLLTQVVRRMRDAGLIEFDTHAQDGMRVRASAGAASFHREATLSKSLDSAQTQVQVLAQVRAAETSAVSAGEQAAQERAAQDRIDRFTAALAELPAVRAVKPVAERGEARVSSTGPEARVMKMADGGFRPAYNWEFVVDTARLVITGVEVINAGSDRAQTLPMLAEDQRRCGRLPHDWLMDGGFVNLSAIEAAEVDRHVRVLAPVPEPKDETRDRYTPLPSDSPAVAAWRERMGTAEAKDTYQVAGRHRRVRQRPSPHAAWGVSGVGARACQGALPGLVGGAHTQLAHLDSRRARANPACLVAAHEPDLTKQGASQTGDDKRAWIEA
jgi:transposase